jgi:hypothetical protein
MVSSKESTLQRCVERFVVSAERLPAQVGLALQAWASHRTMGQEATLGQMQALSIDISGARMALAADFTARLKASVQEQLERLRSGITPGSASLGGTLSLLDDASMQRDLVAARIARAIDEQLAMVRADCLRCTAEVLSMDDLAAERDPFRPRVVVDALFATITHSRLPKSTLDDFLRFASAEWFGDLSSVYQALLDQFHSEGIKPDALRQLKQRAAKDTPAASATAPAAAIAAAIAAAAQAPAAEALPGLSAVDRFDRLATAFDQLFATSAIPLPCKREVNRLQTAVMHVAMVDHGFFENGDHPARQLLVRATRMAAEQGLAGDGGPALAMELEPIFDRVVAGYRQDPECFANALLELETLQARRLSKLATQVADTAAKLKQLEHEEAVERAAAQQALELLVEHNAPPFMARFGLEHWRYMLRDRMLLYGHGSSAVERSRATFALLLESVYPSATEHERQERIEHRPVLTDWVNKVFDATAAEPAVRRQFMEDWRAAEEEALQSIGEAPSITQDDFLKTMVEVPSFAQTTVLAREDTDLPEAGNPAVLLIPVGTWCDSEGPVPMPGRYRLAWVSPLRSRYVLLFQGGLEPCIHTYAELLDALDHGRLHPTPLDNPFESNLPLP